MTRRALPASLLLLSAMLNGPGCRTPDRLRPARESAGASAEIRRIEGLIEEGKLTPAMLACIDLSRREPEAPGLPELQDRITAGLAEQRAQLNAQRERHTFKRMANDVDGNKVIPDTFGVTRQVRGETSPMRGIPTRMDQSLRRKVSVHLKGVTLVDFIHAIAATENINIMADGGIAPDTTMDIDAEDTPLREILDYVSRNMGVAFSVGENVIWAIKDDTAAGGFPMETRLYRLRKGLASAEVAGDADLLGAIDLLVPPTTVSARMFNQKAHVLIVKNTRENLAKIEDLIEAMDVCPPQIQIEARFITAGVDDLTELGVDWVLNSPIAVTSRRGLAYGVPASIPETALGVGEVIKFNQPENFDKGLNLTYTGLLTDPMFQAVLHALEVSGKSRVLSVPKVTTVNNAEAYIRVGDTLRYVRSYSSNIQQYQILLDDGRTVNVPITTWEADGIEEEELGIDLRVTPSVGADLSSIRLKMAPVVKDFVGWEEFELQKVSVPTNLPAGAEIPPTALGAPPLKLPRVKEHIIETEVIVQSGETVVMGGLITSSESRKEEKVPILSSIPIIGRLFRHDTVEDIRQNLLIFVTATLLSERGESLVPLGDR